MVQPQGKVDEINEGYLGEDFDLKKARLPKNTCMV
jgi:hypothetical protein